MLHGKTLHLNSDTPSEVVVPLLKALASQPRWRILRLLADRGHSISEVAQCLDMPAATVAAHVKILEEVGLVHTELQTASHGLQKVCTRTYDGLVLQMPYAEPRTSQAIEIEMPIGAYTAFSAAPTCGLAGKSGIIGYLDDPISFDEPQRLQAGLVWFRSGYLEYRFPNRLPPGTSLVSLQVSMEIASEAPLHNNQWPSDITLWINGTEVGTWTCPGDFGGQRGRLTPEWWGVNDSQFGVLKRWTLTHDGALIDGVPLSTVTLLDLALEKQPVIAVRVGVKPDARHVGGLNLFGRTFGNYPQDLALRLEYVPGGG